MRRGAVTFLLVALVLGAVFGRSAIAQTVAVVVDGRVVGFDQPPVVSGGRLLVPLRGVFERLGAQVFWHQEAGRVVARRAATTVILFPGNRQASVNGRWNLLDSAPIVLQGRVLVPLRFVSEALGADVNWDSAARVAYINSSRVGAAPPPAPAPAEPIRPPLRVPQPQPAPAVVEGTVIRIDAHTSPQRMHVLGNGVRSAIVVTPETSIFVTEILTGRTTSAPLDHIRRGDHVRVTLDPHLRASVIRATYRELNGRLETLSGGVVSLSGQAFRLADDVVFTLDGREVTRDALGRGMEASLRINPQTGEVWEVRARGVAQPPIAPPAGIGLRIDAASLNTAGPLGAGSTFVVTMQGTPGGEGFFDIARLHSGLRMTEGPPGHYTGRYILRPGEAVSQAAVTVRIRHGGAEATRAAGRVTLDGLPPEFTRVQPAPDAVVRVSQPTITLRFVDRGPSGVDAESIRLWVNDIDAQPIARSETSLSYTPPAPLAAGRARLTARVADRAGNVATTSWTFIVDLPVAAPTPAARAPGPSAATPAPAPVAAPVITSPRPQDAPAAAATIKGTATAGHRVQVMVELVFPTVVNPRIVGPLTVTVGANGAWEVQVPAAQLEGAIQAAISAVAIAPSGARSQPATVTLRPPPREPEGPGR